ncbi:hypothetical protein HY025_00630 [Candidatus Daviesbacteria bacterium]|nr:hypothetical protein [Candidatus Daviesbacteria bacterium]
MKSYLITVILVIILASLVYLLIQSSPSKITLIKPNTLNTQSTPPPTPTPIPITSGSNLSDEINKLSPADFSPDYEKLTKEVQSF